ncbi:uncharacterized protein MYCFIDRAFT_174914 [Pseudocercospora fijiensis CIRAD86]|uniref:Uncharacterized protein n=1 Tax=Pseudocercospora fijiensis (strain CIRAD86) TaxID=383855 RepID=M2Z0X3_PSEFD|nr:uncharacterized protein MYCFIDRAFT_174914 [Pseudocercospora fijiensis CIRAD86]EME83490.1 hypothetical protein MYCFIDRAFT_174914 [Pseudocercospora fijiensis CIRAD86]
MVFCVAASLSNQQGSACLQDGRSVLTNRHNDANVRRASFGSTVRSCGTRAFSYRTAILPYYDELRIRGTGYAKVRLLRTIRIARC